MEVRTIGAMQHAQPSGTEALRSAISGTVFHLSEPTRVDPEIKSWLRAHLAALLAEERKVLTASVNMTPADHEF